jgi:hypothetical protein
MEVSAEQAQPASAHKRAAADAKSAAAKETEHFIDFILSLHNK